MSASHLHPRSPRSSNRKDDGSSSKASSSTTQSPPEKSFLANLVERMNPRACLGLHYDDPQHFDSMIQSLLSDLEDANTSTRALERLFDQTDLAHQHNRIPMVCTSQWDIVAALAKCLSSDADRRYACLTLNNLSIPFENKAVLVFGPSSDVLLDAILTKIQSGCKESYLLCILLMNVSYLDDAKLKLVEYNGALDNEKSLLRTMELLLKTYSRFLAKKVLSVEGEAVRWTTGLLRNLTCIETGARLVAKTTIPSFVLAYVRDSNKPLHQWTEDSLEDLSLQVLVNLAKYPESAECLKSLNAQHAFDDIVGKGGIHDVRASFLQVRLH